jgi:lysophospholipid acyltransferase (LPLAT)-like uncharacterized protein
MKIRRLWLIRILGFVAAWLIRLWMATLRYHYEPIGPPNLPVYLERGKRYIYVLWHENILFPAYQCRSPDISVLVSRHADGQFVAEIFRHLGVGLIRGSTTRGSVTAVRRMLRACQSMHLALTPDGPRGPRRRVQAGVIYLAAKTGLPIIALGVGFQNPWRLHSWDRFALPRPWRCATMMTSRPIPIPPDLDKDLLEHYRRLVEDTLRDVSERAEVLAEAAGRWRRGRSSLDPRNEQTGAPSHPTMTSGS